MSEPEVLKVYTELMDTAGVTRSYRRGDVVVKSRVNEIRDAWEPYVAPPVEEKAPAKKAPVKKAAAKKKK